MRRLYQIANSGKNYYHKYQNERLTKGLDTNNYGRYNRTPHNAISIVITTCNGIKYITEQLDSIRTQTRIPDEVIIADDLSSDGTYELCVNYINEYNLNGWHVYRNESNLGPGKNFREAISKAAGEYIFTCDQDDIWKPDKISSMVSVMENRPEIGLLVSNYIPVKDGRKIKARLKNIDRDNGAVIQLKLKDYWLSTLRPGCTFCFRRSIAAKFRVIDIDGNLHDSMLWKYAIVSDSLYLLNRQLILFRRHESNATKVFNRTVPGIQDRIDSADSAIRMCRKLLDASEGLGITAANQELLNDYAKFIQRRIKVLGRRNLFMMICFVVLNFKYYPTARNALSDIYAMIFLK